jgi:zinc protease
VLAVVGDVDPDRALAEVERRYAGLPNGTAPRDRGPAEPGRAAAGPRYRELDGDVRQAQLAFGWRTPGTHDPDTPRLDLAAAVLATGRASRLYRAVRERSLASSVSAYNATPTELGVFVVHLEGDAGRLADAARAAWAEVAALRDGGAREDELERVRRIVSARAVRRLETMEGQASWLAEWESQGDWRMGSTTTPPSSPPRQPTSPRRRAAGSIPTTRARWCTARARPRRSPPTRRPSPVLLGDARAEPTPATGDATVQAPAVHAGPPRAEREEAGVHVFRTARGVPVLVVPKPGARIVHLGVTVLGGAVAEADDALGITALMAATSVKGTATRTAAEIAEAAERMGGSVGASAGFETFGWGISVPNAELGRRGGAARRRGAARELPRRGGRHRAPGRRAAAPHAARRHVPLADAPGRRGGVRGARVRPPVGGTEATLAALTPDGVRDWHRRITRRARRCSPSSATSTRPRRPRCWTPPSASSRTRSRRRWPPRRGPTGW